jgi:hypothetical protein
LTVREEITFLASLPPIASAILVGQDGMKVKLDIPESEMAQAVHLLTMRGKVLEVTVRLDDAHDEAHEKAKRAPARRDLRRSANGRDK